MQLLPGVAAVGKNMSQPREQFADRGQQLGRAIAILYAGRMDLRADQMAAGIGDDVAFAAVDLFSRVTAAWAAALGGLDRLRSITPADWL